MDISECQWRNPAHDTRLPPSRKQEVGSPKAIAATARKLVALTYRMLKYAMEYVDQGQKAYEHQYHKYRLKMLQRRARQMGYVIVSTQSGESVS